MKIRTFYAKNMPEALQTVKTEMGADALLLSSREIPCRSGGNGARGVEVVAAVDAADEVEITGRDAAEACALNGDEPPKIYSPSLLRHHARRRRSAATRRKQRGPAAAPEIKAAETASDVPDSVYRDLLATGVDDWLARKLLLEGIGKLSTRHSSRADLLRSVTQAAQDLLPAPRFEEGLPSRRIVVFVGPTGVGKTTIVAKLAAHLALRKKKKVAVMTLDGYRIGAIEQLRTYASLIGLPFRHVGHPAELPQALEEHKQRDYILVDTTGRGPKEVEQMQDLADFLRTCTEAECHLVLSAATKPSDTQNIIERFEVCRPDFLVFTKIDETTTRGLILTELIRNQKTLSYYSDGQRVPEDLHYVSKERIVDVVLHES